MSQSSSSSGGIGFVGLLTILFIALKLTGHISWSWVWVLSPIWITLCVIVASIVLALTAYSIVKVWEERRRS